MQADFHNVQLANQKYIAENPPQFSVPLMGMEMGTNDLYVIKKLRESEITLARIDAYL